MLSVADRRAALAARGMLALGGWLDPEVCLTVGGPLQKYATRRQQMENVKDNVQQVGHAFREAGFEHEFFNKCSFKGCTLRRAMCRVWPGLRRSGLLGFF